VLLVSKLLAAELSNMKYLALQMCAVREAALQLGLMAQARLSRFQSASENHVLIRRDKRIFEKFDCSA
jgi:hypothetical protein